MRTSVSIRRAAALSAVAGMAACVSTVRATIINWNNAAGGAASLAANWNPAQVPTAADTLVYNLNSTYTVTFSSGVPLSTQHTYKRGTVTLSIASPHTLSSNFRVGDVSGDVATTIITTGVVNAGSVTVGNAAGSTGTLNINDSDADLTTTGAGDIVVASAGAGTMNVTSGGRVTSADDLIIGATGGDGTVNVSGFGTSPFRFSSITTTAADGDIVVGNASGSVAELNIFNGGFVNSSDDVQVGLVGGSNGTLDVGGSGSGTLNVAGDLQVGNNASSTTAGSGSVTAFANGTINVTGTIRLGDTAAGSGTLTCREGGHINTHSIICDTDGGFLNLLGGETHVDGGTLTAPGGILSIEGASGENPFLRLLNGASCTLSAPTSPFRALTIGIINDANVVVDTGSSLNVSSGDVVIGDLPVAHGSLVFSGGSTGSFPSNRRITVGASSFADMTVTGNSIVTAGSMELGAGSSGNGSLLVFGSDLTLAGTLSLGGTPTFEGGTGKLRVEGSGVITASASGDAIHVYAGGTVFVFLGSTLRAPNGTIDFVSAASLTIENGTIEARQLNIGVLNPSLRGTLRGKVTFGAANMVVNPTGPLTIDGAGSPLALVNLGTINVGDTTLTVNSGDLPSQIGNCTLGASGVINGTADLQILPGRTVSGDGTITNSIANSGTITATGDGLTFGGLVSGVGQGMSGARFTFASGGGFTGAGTINAPVTALAGSKLTFTGTSQIGTNTPIGFRNEGELEVASGTLSINDSNGTGAGSLTTIRAGASIVSTSEFAVGGDPIGGVLQGFGAIVAPTIVVPGVLRPGDASGDKTGTLSLVGSVELFAGTHEGEVQIDLGGTAAADRDRVSVIGPITLDGTLTLNLINGFTPGNGFRAQVLSSTQSVSGGFLARHIPPRWHVEIGAKDVVVVYCAGDVNSDGFVNGDDFDDLASAFENGEPLGDFNGDGFINGDDFDEFASAFEEGC